MEKKISTLSNIAARLRGSFYGKKNYVINAITAIGSAKDNELCVIAKPQDVYSLTPDVRAVLTKKELLPMVQSRGIPHIIAVENLETACERLMKMFA